MTGLECFKEEMSKRGMNKAQIESKAVAVTLDIVSQNPQMLFQMVEEAEMRLAQLNWEEQKLAKEAKRLESIVEQCKADASRLVNEEWNREKKYIDDFYEALKNCETAEGRDRVKAAQMFVNSANVGSKYDNTAYIIALGAILSSGVIAPIDELKKINPKFFRRNGYKRRCEV